MAPIILIDGFTASPTPADFVAMQPEHVQALQKEVAAFRRQPVNPERTFAFEQKVAEIFREAGRALLEQEYNHIEPVELQLGIEAGLATPGLAERVGFCMI